MKPFVVTRDSDLSTGEAWRRITDWETHARWVPFTTIRVTTSGRNGVGTVFNARTGLGKLRFDDPMEIVQWDPPADDGPGRCRLEKRGTVMLGWAELSVEPRGSGSRAIWREEARPSFAPGFADGVSTLSGRLLFGRVLRNLLSG